MKKIILRILVWSAPFSLFLHGQSKPQAQQGSKLDCGSFTPPPSTVKEGSVEGQAAVDFLKGAFPATRIPPLSGSLRGKVKLQQHDVLSRFPSADKVVLREQELYLTCQLLNSDKNLRTIERIRYIQAVGEGIGLTASEQKRGGGSKLSAPPKSTSSVSATQAQAPGQAQVLPNCNGNCAQYNLGTQVSNFNSPRPAPPAFFTQSLLQRTKPGEEAASPWSHANYSRDGVSLAIKVLEPFPNAKFFVTCDSPCEPGQQLLDNHRGNYELVTGNLQVSFGFKTGDNQHFLVVVTDPATLNSTQSILIQVFPLRNETVSITSVDSVTD